MNKNNRAPGMPRQDEVQNNERNLPHAMMGVPWLQACVAVGKGRDLIAP